MRRAGLIVLSIAVISMEAILFMTGVETTRIVSFAHLMPFARRALWHVRLVSSRMDSDAWKTRHWLEMRTSLCR